MVQTLFYLQTMVNRNHGLLVYTRHHKNWERSYKSSKDQQQLEQRETLISNRYKLNEGGQDHVRKQPLDLKSTLPDRMNNKEIISTPLWPNGKQLLYANTTYAL